MKKSRFDIGDWVEVRAHVEFAVDGKERKQFRFKKRVQGQICGARYRYIGKYVSPGFDNYEQGYIADSKGVLVWLVRVGVTNRALEVLDEDVEPTIPGPGYLKLPWRYTKMKWSLKERKQMSEYSKSFPRDEKGRFV